MSWTRQDETKHNWKEQSCRISKYLSLVIYKYKLYTAVTRTIALGRVGVQ